MMDLIEQCKDHSIEEILASPDVKERVELYFEHEERFRAQLERVDGFVGNRECDFAHLGGSLAGIFTHPLTAAGDRLSSRR